MKSIQDQLSLCQLFDERISFYDATANTGQ